MLKVILISVGPPTVDFDAMRVIFNNALDRFKDCFDVCWDSHCRFSHYTRAFGQLP